MKTYDTLAGMTEELNANLIRYRCRRGMLELDLVLIPFFDKHYASLSEQQRKQFIELLECTDPELNDWLVGHEQPTDGDLKALVDIIKSSH